MLLSEDLVQRTRAWPEAAEKRLLTVIAKARAGAIASGGRSVARYYGAPYRGHGAGTTTSTTMTSNIYGDSPEILMNFRLRKLKSFNLGF